MGAGETSAGAAGVPGPVVSRVVSRPALVQRLAGAARVTFVSAPPGSGKTVLLKSWISQPDMAGRAGWVPVGRDDRDPQRFWLSVLDAIRRTSVGSALVRAVSAAPDLDGWVLMELLLKDLAPVRDRLWLVIDDVHELGSEDVLRQLELLVMRAPPELRFVLVARHDVRLGLHRLRLEGELTEIRAEDLKFSVAEAAELVASAGVELPASALTALHERTEGWAAGLRLAALSLARQPEPVRFAADFSGSERTVAEYLCAEVLSQQSEQVRRLLLRTCILERVNAELASLLTGDEGAERILLDLERANAFVVSLDGQRTWFRYHQMFADLLLLELRRVAPGEVAGLHKTAAGWLAEHGFPSEAIRHAQAAQDWDLAAGLFVDAWSGLRLNGQHATIHELLTAFPADLVAADAGLAVVAAADELNRGSLEAAESYLGLAERRSASVPEPDRRRFRILLGIVGLLLARERGNVSAVAEVAARLCAETAAGTAVRGCGEDLRALASISLGAAEFWVDRLENGRDHLEAGVALSRRIGRPYLEFTGLADLAMAEIYVSFARADRDGRQAYELARRHGWTGHAAAGVACMAVATVLVWQGRTEEAEPWIERAERTLRAETQPAASLGICYVRALLELGRNRYEAALTALRSVQAQARRLDGPHHLIPRIRTFQIHALIRSGRAEHAERLLAGLGDRDRAFGEIHTAAAELNLAQGDPHAALAALAPVLEGAVPLDRRVWRAQAHLLAAAAYDALGDSAGAESAIEHALDEAEPDGLLSPFLLYPPPGLAHHNRTAHASLLAEIRGALDGAQVKEAPGGPHPLAGPLSDSEIRVLRYLPTNLTSQDIAGELSVSRNTIKTHIRKLYDKLDVHSRTEAVARARDLRLLAPAPPVPGAARH
ncbi:LuxR C-terminal-related transcriptional regulator [Catenulispora pinisilvae]|uniref:LuxR C-terminal-related transcriptional regulator n=1 Tax=Catenulispora pinisilvae TaxID=2705253 RepID=UPI001891C16E|nr:LuxR C-terminal-related transcriptional regulator [Catenulispora pinisilvae]